jgi:hypothetical protein
VGEVHVNMTTTLAGVIEAIGGPNEQDGDFEYAGWECLAARVRRLLDEPCQGDRAHPLRSA